MSKNYDVAIIGAGPAGMMAAIAAAQNKKTVILIEKNKILGKKLLLTGGGRCNVTNTCKGSNLIDNFPKNPKFFYSAFSAFDNNSICEFFEDKGVKLKTEDNGRVFPKSDDAYTILNALIKEMQKLKVEIKFNSRVMQIITQKAEKTTVDGILLENGEKIYASSVILATGGASFSNTGSNGDGYRLAKELGHTVTELKAAEVPMKSNEAFIKSQKLKGLSLQNIGLNISNLKGKILFKTKGDLIFTHFGVSGPAAIRCSSYFSKACEKQDIKEAVLKIDLFPDKTMGALRNEWEHLKKENIGKEIKTILKGWMPQRYAEFILGKLLINENELIKRLDNAKELELLENLKAFQMVVNGTLPLEQAFVTDGGISVNEINSSNMASKLVKGLYFAGEAIDVNGFTGGFNITAAMSTGHLAGSLI